MNKSSYYPQAGSDVWTVYERAGRYHADSDSDNPESIRDCATRAEIEAKIEARAVELEEIRGEREAEGMLEHRGVNCALCNQIRDARRAEAQSEVLP